MSHVNTFTITVPFAKGKGRPRFNRKSGRVYTPQQTYEAEREIAKAWQKASVLCAPRDVPVKVEIVVRRQLPKTTPKWVISEPDLKKPDLDNIEKLVLDGLNGVAYEDDSQVIELHARKEPRQRRETDEMEIAVTYLKDWE